MVEVPEPPLTWFMLLIEITALQNMPVTHPVDVAICQVLVAVPVLAPMRIEVVPRTFLKSSVVEVALNASVVEPPKKLIEVEAALKLTVVVPLPVVPKLTRPLLRTLKRVVVERTPERLEVEPIA